MTFLSEIFMMGKWAMQISEGKKTRERTSGRDGINSKRLEGGRGLICLRNSKKDTTAGGEK